MSFYFGVWALVGPIPSFPEFSYNNNYPTSIQIALFEALYNRCCHSWLVGFSIQSLDHMILTFEKMRVI